MEPVSPRNNQPKPSHFPFAASYEPARTAAREHVPQPENPFIGLRSRITSVQSRHAENAAKAKKAQNRFASFNSPETREFRGTPPGSSDTLSAVAQSVESRRRPTSPVRDPNTRGSIILQGPEQHSELSQLRPRMTKEAIAESVRAYHNRHGASAQAINERHTNVATFSEAPDLSHTVHIDNQASETSYRNAQADLKAQTAAQSTIGSNVGSNISPLRGDENDLNPVERARAYVNRSDDELVADFSLAHGLTSDKVAEHPFDSLFMHVAMSNEEIEALAAKISAVDKQWSTQLSHRLAGLKAAQGFSLAKSQTEARFAPKPSLRNQLQERILHDISGLRDLHLEQPQPGYSKSELGGGDFAHVVMAGDVTLRKAYVLDMMPRADIESSLAEARRSVYTTAPAIMTESSRHLYCGTAAQKEPALTNRAETVNGKLSNVARSVNEKLAKYLQPADFDTKTHATLARALIADCIREQRFLNILPVSS